MTVNFVRQQHISGNVSSDLKKKTIVLVLSHHHSTFFKQLKLLVPCSLNEVGSQGLLNRHGSVEKPHRAGTRASNSKVELKKSLFQEFFAILLLAFSVHFYRVYCTPL